MAVKIGLYMNARRAVEGTAELNANAVANIEQLVALRNAGRLAGVDVLIRCSRDRLEHHRQSADGLDSATESLWNGVREFSLDDIEGARLSGDVGRSLHGANSKMLTAPGLGDFLRKLRSDANSATTTLVLWGHADGPRGMLFARRPSLARERGGRVAGRMTAAIPAAPMAVVSGSGTRLKRDILSPADVQNAFASIDETTGRLGVVCFDACQAACIEFAALLARHADFMVASQTPVPGAGWNYGSWPALLRGMSTARRAATLVAIAKDFAKTNGRNISISVVDLRRIDPIVTALEAVSDMLVADASLRTALNAVRARVATQDRDIGGTVDLIGLFEAADTKLRKSWPAFAARCKRVAVAARAAVAFSFRSPDLGKNIPLNGLSIFYPTSASGFGDLWDDITDKIYFGSENQLHDFKRSRWHRFLEQDRRDRE